MRGALAIADAPPADGCSSRSSMASAVSCNGVAKARLTERASSIEERRLPFCPSSDAGRGPFERRALRVRAGASGRVGERDAAPGEPQRARGTPQLASTKAEGAAGRRTGDAGAGIKVVGAVAFATSRAEIDGESAVASERATSGSALCQFTLD
jgi:hypothetical protein